MTMLTQVLGAFVATIAFSIVIGVPKKFIVNTGAVGGFGWFIYLLFQNIGYGVVLCYFISSIMVALLSHSFARIRKAPVTVFLIPGIIPLVPGISVYRTVYNIIINETGRSSYYLAQTLQIAGVIAIAIFIMDSIFRVFQK
ncbi:threonine/serine exporter family protein [Anaeromicropila herbilytica]|uniref:Membrane protein n=1 Tax=Anaeromicropila herbilytica TaxID=2785025 RepID=A0A7R7EMZ3_9FIRM|nr:threonine/serine exporter family protein [Anaeromicropila herbilytica]BCN31930.1 membrane protein [Anaeromicropila herbilytica]